MKAIYSDTHKQHGVRTELMSGRMVPAFETPDRAELILARFAEQRLGPALAPTEQSLATAHTIHLPRYIEFLSQAWADWQAAGNDSPCMPSVWRAPGMADATDPRKEPATIDGKLGFWSFDTSSAFVTGTWDAIKASYDVALTGADLIAAGDAVAFAVCRPPGHHAGSTFMGGYCFINNAAAAAQRLIERGATRVAILDVDYHHGNGTQEIFYNRADVLVANIHADPMFEYPHYIGFADEAGRGRGEGFNLNLPMPLGTSWTGYAPALDIALDRISHYGPDAVVVSLGVDTFECDPISSFKLKTCDFPRIGERIASLGKPTLFVMEGGYAVADIGINAVGVLEGFEGR